MTSLTPLDLFDRFTADDGRELDDDPCPFWPDCGCGTQSGPHTCEGRRDHRAVRRRWLRYPARNYPL